MDCCPADEASTLRKLKHTLVLCVVRKALICRGVSRSHRKAKTISRKGRESLLPCTTLLHCSLFFLLSPHVSPPPGEVGHGKISYCKYPDRCLTDPWRRQQNAMTSVAITGGSDFTRCHIGRNAITSRTQSLLTLTSGEVTSDKMP
jgi:hypothetical protein